MDQCVCTKQNDQSRYAGVRESLESSGHRGALLKFFFIQQRQWDQTAFDRDQRRTGEEIQGGGRVDVYRVIVVKTLECIAQLVNFIARLELALQGLEIGLGWNDIEVFKRRAVYERADLRLPEAEA